MWYYICMTIPIIYNSIRLLAPILLAFVFVIPTSTAAAQYEMHGHTFSTYAEMQKYMEEYMIAYREVYGIKTDTQSVSTSKSSKSISTITKKTNSNLAIDTASARDLEYHSATLVGKIDFKTSDKVKIWFDYGFSPSKMYLRSDTEVLRKKNKWTSFDKKIINLIPETTYYYRAGGINEKGVVSYGDVQTLTTTVDTKSDNALIKISSSGAQDIDDNRATFRASINFRKASYAYVWFEYGDDEDDFYKTTSKKLVYKTSGRNYTQVVRGLDSNSNYYYRAVAEDANGDRSYGKTVRVNTKKNIVDEVPKTTTNKSLNVTSYGATLSGTVDMNDFRNGKVFFIYGEDKDKINEVAKKYETFSQIKEYGEDRQKMIVDNDLDRDASYTLNTGYLDFSTRYYYAIGVEYENVDDDDVLLMGRVQSFTTKKL